MSHHSSGRPYKYLFPVLCSLTIQRSRRRGGGGNSLQTQYGIHNTSTFTIEERSDFTFLDFGDWFESLVCPCFCPSSNIYTYMHTLKYWHTADTLGVKSVNSVNCIKFGINSLMAIVKKNWTVRCNQWQKSRVCHIGFSRGMIEPVS